MGPYIFGSPESVHASDSISKSWMLHGRTWLDNRTEAYTCDRGVSFSLKLDMLSKGPCPMLFWIVVMQLAQVNESTRHVFSSRLLC